MLLSLNFERGVELILTSLWGGERSQKWSLSFVKWPPERKRGGEYKHSDNWGLVIRYIGGQSMKHVAPPLYGLVIPVL